MRRYDEKYENPGATEPQLDGFLVSILGGAVNMTPPVHSAAHCESLEMSTATSLLTEWKGGPCLMSGDWAQD